MDIFGDRASGSHTNCDSRIGGEVPWWGGGACEWTGVLAVLNGLHHSNVYTGTCICENDQAVT